MIVTHPDTDLDAEVARLRQRVRRLAEEKSNLQLIIRLVERLNPLAGMDDMVAAMLRDIVETIGGTDIKLWYWVEDEIRLASLLAPPCLVADVDDPLADQARRERQFVEQSGTPDASLMHGEHAPETWNWAFPLLIGEELVGVIKLENVNIIGSPMRGYLPIFFSHAALILGNETRNYSRQLAEAARAESEARLRRLIKVMPVPLCYVDHNGDIREFNDRFGQVFGYTPNDLPNLGAWWSRAYPDPEYRRWVIETWNAAVAEAARTGRDIRPMEYRVTCKNGEVRIVEISGVVLGEDFLATLIDLTDRVQAESQRRLAASVFSHSQEGIVIADAANHIVDVNAAFSRLTGYAREEVIGKNPRILASGRHGEGFYRDMWRALNEHSSWNGEIWNRRKDGHVYPEHLTINAVRDAAGKLSNYVAVFSDISHVKEHEAELERVAHFDSLTNLPNRRLLADRMDQAIARAVRNSQPLAVCYLDLDGFKPVNDQYGHETGDHLLIEIAARLKSELRGDDTLARLGGDEFVLLFNDIGSKSAASRVLDRILEVVSSPIQVDQHAISVSASLGVALCPFDNTDADTLLRHADQAMYQAKEGGKNRYHYYDSEQDRLAISHRESLQRLAEALRDEEFVLYYQPKVSLLDGAVIGAEALIRWRHPIKGIVGPGDFLYVMAGSDLEIALGEWVIETALQQISAWNTAGLNMVISVNISPAHLQRSDFAHRLRLMLARYPDVASSQLELEILESSAIEDLEHASRTLSTCLALGVHFALDDFGTGYSSLAYFRRLPVETLKIDQAFVRDMLDDPEDLGIVESVIRLAQAFNRPVIAEGVETIEHGAMLAHLGCHFAQGYGIARPMPADNLLDWQSRWKQETDWHALGTLETTKDDVVLMVAKASHRRWVASVIDALKGCSSDELIELNTRQCRFGRWYHGSGASLYGHFPEFTALDAAHVQVHELAHALLQEGLAGQIDTSARLPELFTLRDQLLDRIDRLIERVHG